MPNEIERIRQIPTRELNIPRAIEWSKFLIKPESKYTLKPAQALVLYEAHEYEACFAYLPVGKGKSLISLLLPSCIDCKRPAIVIPANTRHQTVHEVIPKFKDSFYIRDDIRFFSYSDFSLGKRSIFEYRPDLLILDESHKLANKRSARTHTVIKYMKENPLTKIVSLSGTMVDKSIREYAHILLWSHTKKYCPVPWNFMDQEIFDRELEYNRPTSFVKKICPHGTATTPREAFFNRLKATPGIIIEEKDDLNLRIKWGKLSVNTPDVIKQAILNIRRSATLPNGRIMESASDIAAKIVQISQGYYTYWKVDPPKEYLDARREWNEFKSVNLFKRGLTTDSRVLKHGLKIEDPKAVNWEYWRKKFQPDVEVEWLTTEVLEQVISFVTPKTIIWVGSPHIGLKVQKISDIPYFGQGQTKKLSEYEGDRVCLSIQSMGTGLNLQAFNKNFILTPPASQRMFEQLVGRTARQGQEEETVTNMVLQNTSYLKSRWKKTLKFNEIVSESYGLNTFLNHVEDM